MVKPPSECVLKRPWPRCRFGYIQVTLASALGFLLVFYGNYSRKCTVVELRTWDRHRQTDGQTDGS